MRMAGSRIGESGSRRGSRSRSPDQFCLTGGYTTFIEKKNMSLRGGASHTAEHPHEGS
jgi:hypothetical protein